jgi:hypothetical protein
MTISDLSNNGANSEGEIKMPGMMRGKKAPKTGMVKKARGGMVKKARGGMVKKARGGMVKKGKK